jgi:hypothetical protein
MSRPLDRSADDAPFPFVSHREATAYIGDMAGSLKRIALRSQLPDLARQLEDVEASAQRILQGKEPRHSAKAG